LNRTGSKEQNQADYRQEERRHDLYVDSVNACIEGELIEEALKRIENLRSRTGDDVEGGIECRGYTDFESCQHHDDLKVIQN